MGCAVFAAGIAYCLDFGVGGRIVMFPDAVDTASEDCALPIDDEGRKRDPPLWT